MKNVSSELSGAVSLRIANLYQRRGEYKKSTDYLLNYNFSSNLNVKSFQILTLNSLYSGDLKSANQLCDQTIQLCETSQTIDYSLFSATYGLKGLAQLFIGDYELAEEFLQMSARWAQNSLDQLIAMNNLGIVQCRKTNWDFPFLPEFRDKDRASVEMKEYHKGVRDALDYWAEAVEDSFKSADIPKMELCGPTSLSNTKQYDLAGPGMEVMNFQKQNESISSAALSSTDILKENPHFAVAYATVICNVYEAQVALGQHEIASTLLGTALKALNNFDPSVSSSGTVSGQLIVAPYIGRALFLSASANVNSLQAVTAEGLYRTALQKFENTYAINNPRHLYENARCLHAYGTLLSKWEKRESQGQKHIQEAQALLKTTTVCNNGVRWSQALQSPQVLN